MGPHSASSMTRRHFLRATTLTLGGLGMADLLRLRARATEAGRTTPDTSVILLWLPGGPPHMETYDMKPNAPAEYRGDFKPIPTNVPGMEVCELLPRHARIADKYTLIRSIAHNFADHGGGHKRFLTGRDPKEPTGFVNDFPMVGSMAAKMREGRNFGLPNYVSGVDAGPQRRGRLQLRRRLPRAVHDAVHRHRRPQFAEVRGQEPGHERGAGRTSSTTAKRCCTASTTCAARPTATASWRRWTSTAARRCS